MIRIFSHFALPDCSKKGPEAFLWKAASLCSGKYYAGISVGCQVYGRTVFLGALAILLHGLLFFRFYFSAAASFSQSAPFGRSLTAMRSAPPLFCVVLCEFRLIPGKLFLHLVHQLRIFDKVTGRSGNGLGPVEDAVVGIPALPGVHKFLRV